MDNALAVGAIWRKHGPFGWFRIIGFQLPEIPGYDGGIPGVSVVVGRCAKGRFRRLPHGAIFLTAPSLVEFAARAYRNGNYPATEHRDGEVQYVG